MKKKTYLAIIGTSGVGKNYIQNILIESDDNIVKLNQITTRRMRDNDEKDKDNYLLFTSKQFYSKLKNANLLIAKTEVDGNLYGTLDDSLDDERMYTVIVNSKGLEDLLYERSKLEGQIIVLHVTGDSHDNRERNLDKENDDIHYILEQARTYYTVPVIEYHNKNEHVNEDDELLDPFKRMQKQLSKEEKYKDIMKLIMNKLED